MFGCSGLCCCAWASFSCGERGLESCYIFLSLFVFKDNYNIVLVSATTWLSHRYPNVPPFLSLPPPAHPIPTPLGCHRAWLGFPDS